MKIHSVFLIIISMFVLSCGSSKDSASSEQQGANGNQSETTNSPAATSGSSSTSTTQTQMTTENNPSPEKQQAVKYRLIISFISIGEGTDASARQKMDAVIQKWEAKIGKKIVMETFPWGREGEVDFCFLLNELGAPDQAAFSREMRETFQQQPLIQITEYQESMHKR